MRHMPRRIHAWRRTQGATLPTHFSHDLRRCLADNAKEVCKGKTFDACILFTYLFIYCIKRHRFVATVPSLQKGHYTRVHIIADTFAAVHYRDRRTVSPYATLRHTKCLIIQSYEEKDKIIRIQHNMYSCTSNCKFFPFFFSNISYLLLMTMSYTKGMNKLKQTALLMHYLDLRHRLRQMTRSSSVVSLYVRGTSRKSYVHVL